MVNSQSSLIDKIEYYMKHSDDDMVLKSIFSLEERDILFAMSKFEKLRLASPKKEGKNINEKVELYWEEMDSEKEISFDLKNKVIRQLNILLEKGSIEAWMEIITWYRVLANKGIIVYKFWEFPVLENMIDIFQEEIKNASNKEMSILEIRSMDEMTEVYFRMVFLLRRMAYGEEVTDELVSYLTGKKLFPIFVKVLGEKRGMTIYDWENIMTTLSVGRK